MAKNNLAPPSRNALDPLQKLLQESEQQPAFVELRDYLNARQMMPKIERGFGGGSSFRFPGMFSTNPEMPAAGVVKIGQGETPNAVVHELTHAADRQIERQYFDLQEKSRKQKLTPEEQQFIDAYKKLIFDKGTILGRKPSITRLETAERIAPKWRKEESDYRATSDELSAWGMGSTVNRNAESPAPLHIDPTYATEFRVLLDLASRLQKQQAQSK